MQPSQQQHPAKREHRRSLDNRQSHAAYLGLSHLRCLVVGPIKAWYAHASHTRKTENFFPSPSSNVLSPASHAHIPSDAHCGRRTALSSVCRTTRGVLSSVVKRHGRVPRVKSIRQNALICMYLRIMCVARICSDFRPYSGAVLLYLNGNLRIFVSNRAIYGCAYFRSRWEYTWIYQDFQRSSHPRCVCWQLWPVKNSWIQARALIKKYLD